MQYRSALLVPMFPQTAITYRGSLLVYAPLMGIYLIRIEVLLLRSLSPYCSAQAPKGRDQVILLEPLMEIYPIGNEMSVLRSLSAVVLQKGRDHAMILEPLRRHLDPSGSIGAQWGAQLIIRHGTGWVMELLVYKYPLQHAFQPYSLHSKQNWRVETASFGLIAPKCCTNTFFCRFWRHMVPLSLSR